jgi:hypothetical protein
VDTQKIDSSRVKTHEEILKLFEDVQSAKARVQNPGMFPKVCYEQVTTLKQIDPSMKQSVKPQVITPPIPPKGEILQPEQVQKPFFKQTQKPEIPSEKKKKWFDFLKIEVTEDEGVPPSPLVESEPEDPLVRPSTFVLQLDSEGNLVGFPLKKTHERKKPQYSEESEGEPVKGLKGIIQALGSKFRRKSSEGSESTESSGGGIAEKIKGIFRRKNTE